MLYVKNTTAYDELPEVYKKKSWQVLKTCQDSQRFISICRYLFIHFFLTRNNFCLLLMQVEYNNLVVAFFQP